MNEAREKNWITQEENWSVVSNQVPVAILCVKFNCKSSRIPVQVKNDINHKVLSFELTRVDYTRCVTTIMEKKKKEKKN